MENGKYLVAAAVLSLVVTFTLAALNTHTCSGNAECTGGSVNIANSVCSSGHCACDSAYKEATDTCVAKGLGDNCTATSECAGEAHSECSSASPKTCVCSAGYTAINNDCKRGLGDTCAGDGDCTAGVTDSKCSTAKKCECNTGFTALNNMCKRDGDVSHASSNGLGDTCAADGDCTAGVTDSKCSTAKKCECNTGFTEINKMCKIGLGNPCTDESSCSAVSNAECPTATKTCTCKANFKEDSGQCSTANGLQTLLSTPVALLLSFLTIVVARLH